MIPSEKDRIKSLGAGLQWKYAGDYLKFLESVSILCSHACDINTV
jgi:hypothetical protein